jgi:hypothetical protein
LIEVKVPRDQAGSAEQYRNLQGWSVAMMDIVMLAVGFVLFAVSIAYAYACDVL